MDAVAQSLVTLKSPNTLVVAFEPHLQRAVQAAKGANLLANFVSVEKVLQAAHVHLYDDILPAIADMRRSELIKRLLGQEKGKVFEVLSYLGIVGSSYLDIDDSGDSPILVETTARRRLRQVANQVSTAGITLNA